MLLALLAAEEALADAAWPPPLPSAAAAASSSSTSPPASAAAAARRATGVAVGNGMSATSEVAEAGALVVAGRGRRVSPFFVPRILPNMAAGAISIRHGLMGPSLAPSTACATGGHALGEAFRIIQRGEADVMVAGAAEACVDAISITGFSRLKALSTAFNDQPTKASRPFDAARDGFVMGEGAGVLVLEEAEHARARGARVYAEVRGYGSSGDGHHVTHPHPDGLGALLAMRRALAGSGVSPYDLSYINAHATSTPTGDAIEQAAILSLYTEPGSQAEALAAGAAARSAAEAEGKAPAASPGAVAPSAAQAADAAAAAAAAGVAVGSTKGSTGHLLGAAGAVEAALAVLALRDRRAPPTLNLERPDPALLPCLVGPQPLDLPPRGTRTAVLSNSFGFGGTNTSLLFASPDEP
ncbi:hypothetical protein HYH03_001021 [Edaphochlamys debaryana]|uniref:beta-ketoacyl-[acyl-carrier-protein] synthase I n=1 Tax=Edaphochlamys debaryana TaxID=47281 RepID=A0A836C6J6_9CHLO|nr:hypothetical protein HYH03_001021 [Edaphochlamys debaryana]|eukprot:KAG2501208.1 hypothetical protein HYH03_001021 [Edaphochlamys debaryana]